MAFRTVSGARNRVPALQGLSDSEVERFIAIFNNLEKDGVEEGTAIPQAIGASQKSDMEKTSLNKATTSDVSRDDKGNLVYRNQKFPGYNKPMRSNRDGKQGMVLAKKGDEIKVVHFGDSSMKDNYSTEANDAYYARHGEEDDKFSAKYWSNKYLWPKGSLKGKGPKPLHTLNKSSDMTKQIIKAVNEELKQSIEVVYEPYELDAQEQWMRPSEIRKACENFNANLEAGNILPNMFHSTDDEGSYTKTENFSVIKSWINEVDCVVGGQPVKEGTWICKLQWYDDSAWELRKSNTYQGVSIGALGKINKPDSEES